ncbi:MAG: DUF262 domain-containing HNH endonuclease family protein [Gammaproteobacteria bacterium]|nr:DUF262 domain-containing HNH endonuclease family protein [Gammaproteobacteria bacterium]
MIKKGLDVELLNLQKILTEDDKFFQVPNYQRPYIWNDIHIEQLLDDIITSFSAKKDLPYSEKDYFCGSLVLVGYEGKERYDVIDGQQRLTTFIILFCVVRDLYLDKLNPKLTDYVNKSICDIYDEKREKIKFLTEDNQQSLFLNTVINSKIQFDSSQKEQDSNRYLQNAINIKEHLEEKLSEGLEINEIILYMFNHIRMTVVTCDDEDAAIKIFTVLNNRGTPLSPLDILKSELMQKAEGQDNRKTFATAWNAVRVHMDDNHVDLEEMFNAYLLYEITANPKIRLDKELLAVYKYQKRKPSEVVYTIDKFAHAYTEIQNLQDKCIYCLKYLRYSQYWPCILSIGEYNKYKNFDKLKKYLVAYYYQNWIAGAYVSRVKQTSFNLMRHVKNHEPIEKIISSMKSNMDTYETTKSYKENLESKNIYRKDWLKPVLLLANYFSTDDDVISFVSTDRKKQKVDIEHILPRGHEGISYWNNMFTPEEIDRYLHSIGNLTLLSTRKNIQASNDSFEKKKEAFRDKDNVMTSFKITQDIISDDDWNPKSVEKRKTILLQKINEILDIFE